MSRRIRNILFDLRKTQIEKKEFFFFKYNNNVDIIKILKVLECYGYIRFFFVENRKILKIFVRHGKLINFQLPFTLIKLNKTSLVFLMRRNPNHLLLLNTNNGFVCQKEALKKNNFGFLVFQIW